MALYRKKPVIVDAFCWTGDELQIEDPTWIVDAIRRGDVSFVGMGTESVSMKIKTFEGTILASRGDWIVKGTAGEIYPVKSGIFKANYEPI